MPEESYRRTETYEPIKAFRNFIGLLLIAVGVIIAIWTIMNVYRIFTNPQELEAFSQIIPDRDEYRELDINGKKVIIPKGVFRFMSYGIATFLLLIAGSIGTSFITGGVNLLMSNYRRLELKVTTEIAKLRKKIDEATAAITKKSDSS